MTGYCGGKRVFEVGDKVRFTQKAVRDNRNTRWTLHLNDGGEEHCKVSQYLVWTVMQSEELVEYRECMMYILRYQNAQLRWADDGTTLERA